MTLIRKMAGAASLLVVAALMLAAGYASTASAQASNPMQVYGITGEGAIVAGDTVTAYINGAVVGTGLTTAGGWVIDIQSGANGAVVTFKVNNQAAVQTVTYQGFSAKEVTLTIALPLPTPALTGPGTFAAPPSFGTGNAGSAVFQGGSIAQLSSAVVASGGRTVWAQDANGVWRSYKTDASGAGAFVNNGFNTAFAGGFGTTAVVVLR